MKAQRARGVLVATAIGLATLGITGAPVAAAPVTVEYPSVACPDTGDEGLQQCIDGVDPGSTVILTSEVIDEGALIAKSLTLRAADRSLQPVLLGIVISAPSTGAAKIIVQDIRLSLTLRVVLSTGSGHSVTIQRVDIGRDFASPRGMSVQTSVPASIAIENSIIRSDQEDEREVLGLFAENPIGLVRFSIVGNRITAQGDTESNSGIDLALEGAGSVRADIYNNVIWDVATCNCGAASGISIVPDPQFNADVNIVGNTIDNSTTNAIQQRNGLTTGRLSLDVYNNIFSRNGSSPIRLDSGNPGTLIFRAGFNDYFANGAPNNLDGQSAGPGNLNLNPLYLNQTGKVFRLRPNSPLINKGLTCSAGGIANPDAAGRHRLNGPTVDIGAYETGAALITGAVRVGTGANDTLIGTNGQDVLCGYAGADVLRGGFGADYIDAGSGADQAFGGPNVDRVLGNIGDDRLCTLDSAGGDIADGGLGNDKATTDSGDVRISIEGSGGC